MDKDDPPPRNTLSAATEQMAVRVNTKGWEKVSCYKGCYQPRIKQHQRTDSTRERSDVKVKCSKSCEQLMAALNGNMIKPNSVSIFMCQIK